MVQAEQLTGPVAYHGEGPLWHDGLHWVDMLAGDVLSLGADGSVSRRHIGAVVAALRPRAGGGFVYAVERGFALDRGPGSPLEVLPEVWTDTAVRMNEGSCDPTVGSTAAPWRTTSLGGPPRCTASTPTAPSRPSSPA